MAKQINGAIYYGIGLDNKQLKADALQSQRILQSIGDTAVSEGARIDNTFRNIATSVGLVFGAQQVIQFGRSIVQVRGEFQKLETAFGVLLGNKAQADKLMADAVTLAATTPFGLQDVSSGAKQLLAYGFAAEDIIEDLRRLGDVSAGLGLPLERLTYLYGTTMTQGRLYTRDLMQFTTSGIPLLKALADQFGVAEGEVQKLVEAGEVGFPEVQKAIYAMTGEGGQFNNMMGELAKTIPGQIEKLKDAWQVMLNEIGKGQQGFINSMVDGAAVAVENYKPILEILKTLIVTYGAYKAAVALTSVVQTSNANVRYNAEIQALQALVVAKEQNKNADLQQMVADRQLATVQAEKIAALRAVLAEQLKTAQAEAAAARSAVKSTKEAIIADGYRVSALKAKVSALYEQYSAEVVAGNSTKANTILEKANAQAKQFRAAQTSLAAKQEQLSSLQQAASTKVMAANTLQQGINTASKAAGTVATNIFTAASNLASKAVKSLTAAIKTNPFGLLLTAVMLAIQAMLFFKRRAEESEEALKKLREEQERLANRQKEYIAKLATEQTEIDILFGKLRVLTEGTREYNRTKEQIISRYGQYLNGLSEEIRKLNDVAGAYRAISSAALQAARDRIVSEATTASATDFAKKEADIFTRLRRNIVDTWGYGKEQGEQLFSAIRQFYEDGIEIDAEMRAEFERRMQERGKDKIAYGIGSWSADSTDQFWNYYIKPYLHTLEKGRTAMNAEISEIESILGTIYKNKPDDSPFVTYAQQVANTTEEIVNLKSDLKSLRAGVVPGGLGKGEQFDFAAGINEKQKALKDAEERLNTLLGIDPKEYNKAISNAQNYKEELKKLLTQLADYAAQAKIDAMEDGLEKTLAQNELNYQRELAQIKEQEEALLAARQKTLKEGETATLSDAEQAGFATRRGSAATERDRGDEEARKKEEKRIKEERDAALEGFRSFEQEYLRLYEEFQEKRKKAEAKGADAAGLANADAVFEKSIQDLASRFAENNPEFAEWATGIDNLVNNATESGAQAIIDKAIEDLKAALASAKATVSSLMEGGIDAGEGEAYGQALARIVKLEAELKALQSDSASKKVNSGWKKTYSTLNKVADEFGEIGDQIGGTAGEAIRLASTVATSTISMINGIKTVTGVAAASMSALEKASVILTVISAAFQIAMAIASLFNDDKAKEKQIERLQGEIDSLRWELENADVLRLQKDSGIEFLKLIRDTYAQTRDEVISLHGETGMYYKNADDWYERLMNRLLEMAHYEEIVEKSAGKLADTYANIDYAAGKALGEERYKNARSELENLAEQQLKIQEQIDAENSKKKTDKSKVKDWEHEIQELGEEAAALINDIVEEIVGGSATDIASQLGDAFFDAFEAGEDAAKAWGDTVNDIVGDIMRRMLVQKFVEERVGAIFNKYKNVWFPDGKFAGTDAILGSMAGLTDDLNGVGEAFSVIWDSLPDEIKNLIGGNGADEASREASSKGITSVSQDSFEEYLGRVTAIQGHTFSIAESSKTLVAQSAQILQVLSGIRDDTRYLSRLEVMEGDIRAMRSAISDIDLKGIKLRQ